MLLLSCSVLLFCLSANAEDNVVWRESGENVTLECSFAKCPSSIDRSEGMYLYHDFKKREEVLYYHSDRISEKITPRIRYLNRVEKKGSLKNHTVTISNLTVGDSGIYECVYKINVETHVKCNVYILLVLGVEPCPRSEGELLSENSPPLVLIIVASCAISIVATLIFILLIFRVKQWTGRRRSARTVPNDCVYEVMTNKGINPAAAPEVPLLALYASAQRIQNTEIEHS